ncbi:MULTISPECIES: SDR family oxidoreductase [unclassified Rhodococcus (in: high G+C Gram-positive bacteria)]|uniref:SDR family oxidoreductase n=1 Tax=unclassified Rhodococcus (in: high G+C Gram-positive bacteria) TaxID=192944 RepID=UPI00092CA1A0|nr:SDR family oxidoreductase [Rhodococcus sp. M8]OLL16775.1 short chain dehydrogenase [Rhodococcus sp. M8]QPG46851.1 SDR family oxidoreductase [Rhodococcus sp. M8]
MATYLVTGGTGFLGTHVLGRLLATHPDADVHVLVRPASLPKFEALSARLEGGTRLHPLLGDLTEPGLGLEAATIPPAEHVLHLGAIYDLTAGEEQAATNVAGTRGVIALAEKLGATLHHVSSVAVAGDHRGTFAEDDLDLGQHFPSPYHRTKFEAEKAVRASRVRRRIYRPSAIVGSSTTGEIDKIDGPYYFFPALAALAALPSRLPLVLPDLGDTNLVPVDYVAAAIVELMHRPGLDGRTFHLVSRPQPVREVFAALAAAAGAPVPVAGVPGALVRPLLSITALPGLKTARRLALRRTGIPPVVFGQLTFPSRFADRSTREALRGSGITLPEFAGYAPVLWRYWREHLDPGRARSDDPRGPLVGRHVLITGASSGIGRASAIAAAREGAVVFALARRAEELDAVVAAIRAGGGSAYAYPCDLTDPAAVERTVQAVLAEHDHVDMLVNNAGRSIRRGLYHSTDRLHDFERTMAVNYFGAVRLTLALVPHMRARRFGHIVNISTAGVQARTPRYAAYIASKSALEGFADVAASETRDDGITFTTIHMPLVRTPMIEPSGAYNPGPAISPEDAARMVVRALVERPKRIDVPIGTLGELGGIFAPDLRDRMFSLYYHAYPDAPAARGEQCASADAPPQPRALPRPVLPNPAVLRRIGRLLPGVHW